MICDMCGAKGLTSDLLEVYKTDKVKSVCADCGSDLDKLKADCRKLSDKTNTKINRRAAKVESAARSQNTFWSVVHAGTVAIKNVLTTKEQA